jgi:hypothetical protein
MRYTKKQLIRETLGVPEGLIEFATEIYHEFISKLEKIKDKKIELLEAYKIKIEKPYKILDVDITSVVIDFSLQKIDEMDEIIIAGFTQGSKVQLGPDFNLKYVSQPRIKITVRLIISEDATIQDVIDKLKDDENYTLPSFTHEIKHYIDGIKKPFEKHTERVKYQTATKIGFGDISPLNEFSYAVYFISAVENLVRPSELTHMLKMDKVKKENFVEFITSTRIFKELKKIQNFTLEGLKEQLKEYIPSIKKLFEMNSVDFDGMSDEELIDKALELYYVNLSNHLGTMMRERLTTSPIEQLIGFIGDKDVFFRKFVNEITKYQNDIDGFYLSQENKFHREATKMIKKLSKLYAHPVVEEQQTIKNPKLWYKFIAKPMKLETEFKFGKKNLNEMSPHSTGIKEFIQSVKEVPGLLKALGFKSISSLEEYLRDADYEDFEELRKEVNNFFKKEKK